MHMPSPREMDNTLFYEVFNASPIGIVVENLEGQPLFVNSALCAMLGFSEHEILGKHCIEFFFPEDVAKDWALFEQLRGGRETDIRQRSVFFDGTVRWSAGV
jgi:PAS domain S-box-containing protein